MSPQLPSADSQIELVMSEVRRLEEVAHRNEEELGRHQQQLTAVSTAGSNSSSGTDEVIKSEISQLRQRLAGTDQELHKTNVTLR